MTGAQLVAFVKQRLGTETLSADERYTTANIEDALTFSRDQIVERMVMAAPVVVQQTVTLDVNPTDSTLYTVPSATKDPLRVLEVREVSTGQPLDPSGSLNQDGGHYRWNTTRELQLADDVSPSGGLEADVIVMQAAITNASAETAIGLPTPFHRAIGLGAAVLLLTVDEETDARVSDGLYEREMDRLERVFGEFDQRQGATLLRSTQLANYADEMGDMIP